MLMAAISAVLILAMLATVLLVRERSAVDNPAPDLGADLATDTLQPNDRHYKRRSGPGGTPGTERFARSRPQASAGEAALRFRRVSPHPGRRREGWGTSDL